jgi:two-component system chemotaxis response regulator CheB
VIGVVLSGARDDGTAGLATVAEHGGVALVQDPSDALYASMPRTAMEHVPSARPVRTDALGKTIGQLVASLEPASAGGEPNTDDRLAAAETAMANMDDVTADAIGGEPSGYGCPSCSGGLFQLPGKPGGRYRCRVGHAWSAESLLDEQTETMEAALWMALRGLEEKAALSSQMATSARKRGSDGAADRYDELGNEALRCSGLIRELILRIGEPPSPHVPAASTTTVEIGAAS